MAIALLLLGFLALSALAALSIRAVLTDGRPICPPRSRDVDTDFVAPALRNDFRRIA